MNDDYQKSRYWICLPVPHDAALAATLYAGNERQAAERYLEFIENGGEFKFTPISIIVVPNDDAFAIGVEKTVSYTLKEQH